MREKGYRRGAIAILLGNEDQAELRGNTEYGEEILRPARDRKPFRLTATRPIGACLYDSPYLVEATRQGAPVLEVRGDDVIAVASARKVCFKEQHETLGRRERKRPQQRVINER